MVKNKKLVVNIALKKEGLASRLEADHNLGSSREENDIFGSLDRRRDVFQSVCYRAEEIDKATDDHSSVRDGVMRELDVGRGLSGALNRLREQRTFKEESKVVGVTDNHEDGRFRDGFKDIRIDRVEECGKISFNNITSNDLEFRSLFENKDLRFVLTSPITFVF